MVFNDSQKEIHLKYYQSTFDIYLSTLTYQRHGSIRFAYQINRNGWIDAHSNMISFIGLPPGTYSLKIKAMDNNGFDLTEDPLAVVIRIQPPWWRSSLAFIVYGCLVLALVFIIIRRYQNKQKIKLQRQLRDYEAEKEKELYQTKINFFYNIAHEIRTPVTLIKTPLERLIKYAKICDRGYRSLLMMDRNADRLLKLVNQLLDFRSAENEGGSQLYFRREDILSLLHNNIEDFHDSLENYELQMNVSSSVDSLYADVDREAFYKIMSNLLSNAIKFGEHLISIGISVDSEAGWFHIDVSNDGASIPTSDVDKIFEPFYRSEETSYLQGSGLGLSLTKFLVTLHNGEIHLVESNKEKTTFRLSLPIHQSNKYIGKHDEKGMNHDLIESHKEKSLNPKLHTILVVEDDKEMNLYITSLLIPLYNVENAENGKQALDIIKERSIHLVISDIMMPVMGGYELLKEIKSDESISHIPIILLTVKATIPDRLKGIEMGADAYIDKPFSSDVLLAQISNLISNRENIRQFYYKTPFANMKSVAVSKADESFLDSLNNIINEHLSDVDLSMNVLADYMNMSRPTFYRRISSISNTSPNDLVRIARLKKAAELLITTDMKIYEVSEAVGFRSQSYFWSSFIKHFGVSPSKYAKMNRNKRRNE
ncbi:MAG: response regulator [Bacteroidaceae bacterium]|nr:response regulator [Bacteroidaceae bacterium]